MGSGGKGSKQRPTTVTKQMFDNNWNTIFNKKCQKKCQLDTTTNKCIGCNRSMEEITSKGNK